MRKSVLIIGGNEFLGQSLVKKFKNSKNFDWNIASLDFSENKLADVNIIIDDIFSDDSTILHDSIISKIGKDHKFSSVICAAGYYEAIQLNDNKILSSTKKMMSLNFNSTLLTLHLAQKYLLNDSLIVLRGSKFKKNVDNFDLSYYLSKKSVDNLVDTVENYSKLLPLNTKVIRICMEEDNTLETNSNHDKVSSLIIDWSENIKASPKGKYSI